METRQVYELTVRGHLHRVETSVGGWRNEATWWVDDEEIATGRSSENSVRLAPDDDLADHEAATLDVGAIRARFTTLGAPVRATWFEGEPSEAMAAALIGTAGIDLVPEGDSPAARREERMRANPRLFAARHVVGGVAKVVMPLLFTALMIWLAGRIPWPDWGLPSIPWPSIDLPAVPWPDWQLPRLDWDAPGWLIWLAEHAKYVIPILIGLGLARREMTRRREQDALREQMAAGGPSAHAADDSAVGDVPTGETDDAEGQEEEATGCGDDGAGDVDLLGGDIADEPEGRPLDEPRGQVEAGTHVAEDGGHGKDRPDR